MENTGNSTKILVIEKEYIVGFDLLQNLKMAGFDVIFKSTLEVAANCIKREKPDFVIADTVSIVGLHDEATLSVDKDQVVVLCKDLNVLASFDKPFRSEMVVKWLSDHLHNCG